MSMSTYEPESELSRFNAQTGSDWFAVSAELCDVVAAAQQLSGRTGGAFDVTVVGVLSAVMSTADGLVVSSSQIVANDLYRRTIAPRLHSHLSEAALDRRVLMLSRVATVVVLLLAMGMAWALLDVNIALIVWIGNGCMMAAFAGPLVVGALWRGVTAPGAYAGLLSGFGTFLVLHTGVLDPAWFGPGVLYDVVTWLLREAPNPYSCAAVGEIVSVLVTVAVSKLTRRLPEDHVAAMFGPAAERGA
jgi:sodium/proline symporter